MNAINIVFAIISIGLLFGIAEQFGSLIAKHIFSKFDKPLVVRLKKEDGSIEEIKLTKMEAKGFHKVWDKMHVDSKIYED